MRVLVTGATGLIGGALTERLSAEGHAVVVLSRSPKRIEDLPARAAFHWQPMEGPPPAEAFEGVDAVVHLAGEPIAARPWTAAQKQRIRDSRVVGTGNLVAGILAAGQRPQTLVSASAVGFYGDRGDEVLDESATAGEGFLTDVCREWESAASRAEEGQVRVVKVRTGVVLSARGGALKKMLPAFRLGVAGKLGGGRQWFPWIHVDDIASLFHHAVFETNVRGVINGAAPGAVTNAEFTRHLAAVLRRPAFMAVPAFALKLLMGEMSGILLASQRVAPAGAAATGFGFQHPELKPALEDLLGRP